MGINTQAVLAEPVSRAARHPLWMLIGAVIGTAAAVGGMAMTEWLVPGAAGSQSLFFPMMLTVMAAGLFRRGLQGVSPVWPLVGFPLIVATIVFLGALVRPTIPPGGGSPSTILLMVILLASIAYSKSQQERPTPEKLRRGILQVTAFLVILVMACVALCVTAYFAPLPAVQAVIPAGVASACGVWLSLSLVAVAWVLTDRISPGGTPAAS